MDVGNSELTFAEAFDSDLKTYGLEQSRVCELLSVGDEVPISSAAISNWKRRNTLPLSRLDKLVEIFGPDEAAVAQRQFRRIAYEAGLMGVRAEYAESPEKAAKMIMSWETKPHLFREVEEEEEEEE
jgi:hypothetical protein